MTHEEINTLLSSLDYTSYQLENEYAENGGEETEQTILLEGQVNAMKALLNSEGVDYLGRWMKAKEDKKKALKAEKDYITRQMEAIDRTLAYIKFKMNEVMEATGCEKVKGSLGYTFAKTTAVKTDVDKELLRGIYQSDVEQALENILPKDVTVTLGASVSKLDEGEDLPVYYTRTETPTVRFTKPRANKE